MKLGYDTSHGQSNGGHLLHIIIEDTNRKESVAARTKAISVKANTIQDKPFHKRYANKTDHNNKNM